MEPIRIILIAFALFAVSRAYLRYREKRIKIKELAFWTFTWALVLIIAIKPAPLLLTAKILGISRGVDVLVYLGVAFLFYLLFKAFVALDIMNQKITILTREVAILKHYINKKRKR